MVYIFKSRATGDLPMNTATAELILQSIGHEISPKGVIQVSQMPSAIQTLKALCEGTGADAEKSDTATQNAISQHVKPVIEMLEQALDEQKDITWGL